MLATHSLVEVSLAPGLRANISGLRNDLAHQAHILNLNPQAIELLVLAAENNWCPIATLHSAGHLERMSSWQTFNVFSEVLVNYFPLSVHSLAESTGYAIIHQDNGNCIVGDPDGGVEIQVISPLDIGFITYLASAAKTAFNYY